MSQPSVTASEDSDYFSRSRPPRPTETRERSLDDNKDEEYEFEDLVHYLAESFLSYKRKESVLCDCNHAAPVKAFMRLLFMFVSTISDGHFVISNQDNYIFCVESLWNVHFLSDLLSCRRVNKYFVDGFHQATAAPISLQILGSLEKMIISLIYPSSPQRELPSSLKERQQADKLRAVTQLPDGINKFPDILSSPHSSPAAKRLVLSILFGLFVLEPAGDQWEDSKIDPSHLLECLQYLVRDIDPGAQRNIFVQVDDDTKVLYAMIWALYSTIQCIIDRRSGANMFQPHTLSILLSMLNFVFANSDPSVSGASFYVESPDAAQTIVLQWGECIPFAWSRWDDILSLDFDLIIKLTANWMCRLDQESLSLRANSNPAPSRLDSDSALAFDQPCAIAVIMLQVKNIAINEMQNTDSEIRLVHISRCVRFAKFFLQSKESGLDCVALIEDFIIILFTLQDSEEQLSVKGEILDLLCSMKKSDLGNALSKCQSDPKRRVQTEIEGKVQRALRGLQARNGAQCENGTLKLTPCLLVDLFALLNLICLICSTGSKLCLTASAISLLSTVINIIESGSLPISCCLYALDLRAAMLSCLTSFEALHRNSGGTCESSTSTVRPLYKLWDDNAAFALALNAGAWSHLPLSSAFATYVISNTTPLVKDRLLCIETWNYLRDTLLLALSQAHKTSVNTANDCLKNICKGLKRILKQADESAVRYIRASPMLFNLAEALSSVVHRRSEGNEDPSYANLVVACEELLTMLNKDNPDTMP